MSDILLKVGVFWRSSGTLAVTDAQLTWAKTSPLLLRFRTVMFSDLSAQKEGSSLLCRPASEEQGPVFERTSLAYSPRTERFKVGERSFSRQYAHIYAARLMQMRPLLSERAQQKWGKLRTFL